MDTRSGRVFRRLVMVVIISSIKWDFINADDCKHELKALLVNSTLSFIGAEILEDYKYTNVSFFVYSEMKIFDKLFNLHNMGSDKVQKEIKKFIGLEFSNCNHSEMCGTFEEIIRDMNNRNYPDLHYASTTFYQTSYSIKPGFHQCTTRKRKTLNFRDLPDNVLTKIRDEYSNYGEYKCRLQQNLENDTEFYLVDSLKVSPSFFRAVDRLETEKQFKDLHGRMNNIYWVKLEGGVETATMGSDRKTHRCLETVEISRTDLNGGRLYMMYFRPEFTIDDNVVIKTESIKSIFLDLRYFVDQATNHQSMYSWETKSYLAVPRMSFSSELQLKPIMEDKMPYLFGPNYLTNLYTTPTSLPEFRSWDYLKMTASGFPYWQSKSDDADTKYIKSPFVFALVDAVTGIILKTGAYLSPVLDNY